MNTANPASPSLAQQDDSCPTDLDELIALASSLREQHGNIPLGVSSGSGWVSTLHLSLGRLGRGGGARKLVSRGGDPILVFSSR